MALARVGFELHHRLVLAVVHRVAACEWPRVVAVVLLPGRVRSHIGAPVAGDPPCLDFCGRALVLGMQAGGDSGCFGLGAVFRRSECSDPRSA
jgi:hypothetical protein